MAAGETSARVLARLFALDPEDGLDGKHWSLVHCDLKVPADLSMFNLPSVESLLVLHS